MDILIEKNVPVPMTDGVELLADVYRPAGAGRYPVLLTRLPYNKEAPRLVSDSFDVLRAVQAGYVVVAQDTRGRYASGGRFNPFFDEASDGADTIAWAAGQSWSTGAVGMFGASYVGATQWTAASQAPPALAAIAPFVTTDQYYESWAYQGGAFQLGFNLHWTFWSLAPGEMDRRTGAPVPGDLPPWSPPLTTMTSCTGGCHCGDRPSSRAWRPITTTGWTTRPMTSSGGQRPHLRLSGTSWSRRSTWGAGTTFSSRGRWPTTSA